MSTLLSDLSIHGTGSRVSILYRLDLEVKIIGLGSPVERSR